MGLSSGYTSSGLSGGTSPSMNAGELVTNAWTLWKDEASNLAASAEGFLSDLSGITISPISTADITFTAPNPSFASSADFGSIPNGSQIAQTVFSIPRPPAVSNIVATIEDAPDQLLAEPVLQVRVPGSFSVPAPTSIGVNRIDPPTKPTISVTPAPTFRGSSPSVQTPSVGSVPSPPSFSFVTPSGFTGTKPSTEAGIIFPNEVTPPTISFPTAPADTTGSAPGLPAFSIPDSPELDLPSWSGVAPISTLRVPDVGVAFEPSEYTSTELDEVKAAISSMLTGTGGIPAQIWDAMFNKARADEERIGAKQIAAAFDEWSSRGFSLPAGVLDKQLKEIRADVSLKSTALIQGLTSERAKSELDNLRQAVVQGVALEAHLMDLFDKSENRLVAIQELEIKAATEIFNMQVSIFNTQLEAYKTEASVYKDRVQAALAEIEVFKAEIDAEKLKLESGKIAAEIYDVTVKAYGEKVNAYKVATDAIGTQVNAYAAQVEARKSHLDGERLKLGIVENKVKLYATEVEAYKSMTQADSIINDTNKIKADAYRAEVEGYRAEVEGAKISLGAIDSRIRAYQSDIEAYKAKIQATSITNESQKHLVDNYQAEIASLNALVSVEKLQLDSVSQAIEVYQAKIEGFKANIAGAEAFNNINSSKAAIYKASVDGYSARVQGYRAQTDATISIAEQKNKANEYVNTRYQSQIEAIKAQISQETGRLQQMISFFDSKSRVHKANADISQGEAQSNITSWQAIASVAAEKAKVSAEKAKVDLEQILRIAEIESANARTAAQVYGQVGAATLAGVTMSAGINERNDWSDNYSENHNYSYEA